MSGKRKIELPVAVITDAKVIFEGQRKPRIIEVRADLIAEVDVISGDEAPLAATAHLAGWRPRGAVLPGRDAERIDYFGWNGRLWRKSLSRFHGEQKETLEIDEALLRSIMAAEVKVPDNALFARTRGTSPLAQFSLHNDRHDMPTLGAVSARQPIREIVDDGMTAANRQVEQVVNGIVLKDGLLCQKTRGPLYAIFERYQGERQVAIPSSGINDFIGAMLFGPNRAEDAEAMCSWLCKRDRRVMRPRHDVIEVVNPDLVAIDEPAIIVGHQQAGLWSDVGNLLHFLPGADVMRWVRLRDLEVLVRRGHAENAVPAMVAFRDFVDGVKSLKLGPHGDDARESYLKMVRRSIFRICDIELPRMGIGPTDGALAPADDRALDSIEASLRPGEAV